jgi:hypothetical protein
VESRLVLNTAENLACFCMGDPMDAAAAGSPYLGLCPIKNGTRKPTVPCHDHTLGFAAMVEPLAQFAVDMLRP